MKDRVCYYVSGPLNGGEDEIPLDVHAVSIPLQPDLRTLATDGLAFALPLAEAVYERLGNLLIFRGSRLT